MLTKNFDLRPSLDDSPGVVFVGAKPKRVRESLMRSAPPDTTSTFDDTHLTHRTRRLREAHPWEFQQGVPTANNQGSSKNYDVKKLVDGEHKSLLILGRINEAMENDDHDSHIYSHRIELADPKLSETRRAALMDHIESHVKAKGAKLKAVQKEAKEKERSDITKNRGYGHGVGMLSRALPANTSDVIPQDSQVDLERKRTAGNISMEARRGRFTRAQREAKINGFGRAVSRAYGRRRSL